MPFYRVTLRDGNKEIIRADRVCSDHNCLQFFTNEQLTATWAMSKWDDCQELATDGQDWIGSRTALVERLEPKATESKEGHDLDWVPNYITTHLKKAFPGSQISVGLHEDMVEVHVGDIVLATKHPKYGWSKYRDDVVKEIRVQYDRR